MARYIFTLFRDDTARVRRGWRAYGPYTTLGGNAPYTEGGRVASWKWTELIIMMINGRHVLKTFTSPAMSRCAWWSIYFGSYEAIALQVPPHHHRLFCIT